MWSEKLPDGRYKFRERYIENRSGKERKVSVILPNNSSQSRKKAEKMLLGKIEEKNATISYDEITVEDLVSKYLEWKKATLKKSTYRKAVYSTRKIKEILLPDTICNKLTVNYITSALLKQKESNTRMNGRITTMKAMFRWGYSQELLQDIPYIEKLQFFKDTPMRKKIEDKYLEREELRELLLLMQGHKQWRLMTEFLAVSGLRIGELLALNRKDVDLVNRTIYVNKTYDSNNKESSSTKTAVSCRDVFIQDELLPICKRINLYMKEKQLRFGYRSKLFVSSETGNHIDPAAFEKYFKCRAEIVKGHELTLHSLRHTHASLLAENGMDLDGISRRLGHADSKITKEIYIHVTKKMRERDKEKLQTINML